jgi:glutamate-ammonia-ligase adenylyltransferase
MFHLKQDRGAIVDIEFIAQFAVLCFSSDHPDLIRYTDNIRIFQALSALGIAELGLTQSQIEDLSADYLKLRFEIHYRALGMTDLLAHSSDWRPLRLRVASAWRAAISDSLES